MNLHPRNQPDIIRFPKLSFDCVHCRASNNIPVNPDLITVETMMWMGEAMRALKKQNEHLVDLNMQLMERLNSRGEEWKQ